MTADEIARYVELDPRLPWPGKARLIDNGVNVWAIIGYLQKTDWDIAHTAEAYDAPVAAIEAAIAYYHRNQWRIDAVLEEQAASFEAV